MSLYHKSRNVNVNNLTLIIKLIMMMLRYYKTVKDKCACAVVTVLQNV